MVFSENKHPAKTFTFEDFRKFSKKKQEKISNVQRGVIASGEFEAPEGSFRDLLAFGLERERDLAVKLRARQTAREGADPAGLSGGTRQATDFLGLGRGAQAAIAMTRARRKRLGLSSLAQNQTSETSRSTVLGTPT